MELSEALAELRAAHARGDLTATELRRQQRRLTNHFIAVKAGRISPKAPVPGVPVRRQVAPEAPPPTSAGMAGAVAPTASSASGMRANGRVLAVAVVVAAVVGALAATLVLTTAGTQNAATDGPGQDSDSAQDYGGDGVDMSETEDHDDGAVEQGAAAAVQAPAGVTYVFVPDITGLDPNSAYDALEAAGLRMSNGRLGGDGFVSTQSPRSGTRVPVGSGVLVGVSYG